MVKISLETLRKIREALSGLEGELVEDRVLRTVFERVENANDWKAPINRRLYK